MIAKDKYLLYISFLEGFLLLSSSFFYFNFLPQTHQRHENSGVAWCAIYCLRHVLVIYKIKEFEEEEENTHQWLWL
ncbi:hypothetical protein L6164_024822 [Bauhinia variegata]|uniref:Uncharacterized protein n=1 Tax=Bauhinia variegata TaxID=167791 RepID=A0ACB9LYM8_BAUVA|nr:hypothetical protein L6164_024822 [Bauhinia variegata]